MRILRLLSSFTLPCGCIGGVYELYDGTVVRLIDERAGQCPHRGHSSGARLPADTTGTEGDG
jgi:hypothetical protein